MTLIAFDHWLFRASLTARLLQDKIPMRVAAKQAGVSTSTISRLASGELPDMETFDKIVSWLGKDASSFFRDTQKKSPIASHENSWGDLYRALETLGTPHDLIEAIVIVVRLVGKRQAP